MPRQFVAVALLAWFALLPDFAVAQGDSQSKWYDRNDSNTVFVFVHGVFSDSVGCWTAENKAYWPALVKGDARLERPSIYLGSYPTNFTTGRYGIREAAADLFRSLSNPDAAGNPPMLDKQRIVFIAHSTGGLVVRQMLVRESEAFKDKIVGLVLMASPSHGSDWSDKFAWLRDMYGNRMVEQLSPNSEFMIALDQNFAEMWQKKRLPGLTGVEAFETRFVVPRKALGVPLPWFAHTYVVDGLRAQTYFGPADLIDSDHFTIVKPPDMSAPSHLLLVNFYTHAFRDMTLNPPTTIAWGRERSVSGRTLFHAQISIPPPAEAPADMNAVWSNTLTVGINRIISKIGTSITGPLMFDGALDLPSVRSNELERLTRAGRALNALAVAATTISPPSDDTQQYRTHTIYRALPGPDASDDIQYPEIDDSIPAQDFTAFQGSDVLKKEWGYYTILALTARCLNTPACSKDKTRALLRKARASLGPGDDSLIQEFNALIARAGG